MPRTMPRRWALLPLALGLLFGACKRTEKADAQPLPSAVRAPAAPVPPPRCRALEPFALTLQPEGAIEPAPVKDGEEPGDEALLPFGVELGDAVTIPGGFAVSGLRGGGQAFVALLTETSTRRIDLSTLHGDPEPPALGVFGARLLVAVTDSDAAGRTLKLAAIDVTSGLIEWGSELSRLGREVTSVGVGVSGERGLLVFAGGEPEHQGVFVAPFSPSDVKGRLEPRPLDLPHGDLPAIAARAGGFWLGWVRTLEAGKVTRPSRKGALEKPTDEADESEAPLVDAGLEQLQVQPLELGGKPAGAPRALGAARRQAFFFELATSNDSLLVATRADSTTPGAEGGGLVVTTVKNDGSVQTERLEDDEIGAGVPAFFGDGASSPWVAVSSPTDATRFGRYFGPATRLLEDPAVGRDEIIAAAGERFLLQRARGRSIELGVVACAAAPAVAPEPSRAPAAAASSSDSLAPPAVAPTASAAR